MDPESLEELKEQQAKMARMQSAVASGDLKSGQVRRLIYTLWSI
jgi:hypothetical protein